MSQLYDFAQWAGITPATERNPISLVKVEHATRRRKPRSLTVEEFQRILNHLKEPLRSIAIVAVSLGLRASEVLGLKWKHVDWLNSRLAVEQRIYRQQVDYTKTRGSSGELNVDASVLQVLKDWWQASKFHGQEDWIWASPNTARAITNLLSVVLAQLQQRVNPSRSRPARNAYASAHVPLVAGLGGNTHCGTTKTHAPFRYQDNDERVRGCR